MSLYVIGVGHAFPEGRITNDALKENGISVSSDNSSLDFVAERATTLPLFYITETKNIDTWVARSVAQQNASDLGAQAARLALERAGLTSENIGLILGDCNTPIETTPGEAQRIGGKLGIRCPAYDMTNGVAGLPQMVEMLLAWKASRVPDYVLLVTSGVATQSVNYSNGQAHRFGDGAAAMVLAKKTVSTTAKQFRVVDAYTGYASACDSFCRFPISGHIEVDVAHEPSVVQRARELVESRHANHVFGTIYASMANASVRSCHRDYGDSVGAAPVATLSLGMGDITAGDQVNLVFVGAGARFGDIALVAE